MQSKSKRAGGRFLAVTAVVACTGLLSLSLPESGNTARAQSAAAAPEPPSAARVVDSSDFFASDTPLDENELAFPPWSNTLLRLDFPDAGAITLRQPYRPDVYHALSGPLAVTFDSVIGLALIDAGRDRLWLYPGETGNPSADGRGRSFDFKAVGVERAVGLALNPHSGVLFVLDRNGRRLLRLRPGAGSNYDGTAARRGGRLSVRHPALKTLRGLAFNPTDGRLYSIDGLTGDLIGLSDSGSVLSRRALNGIDPDTFRAMVFAPSSDRTDADAVLSLYVVSGGAADGGRVTEWTSRALSANLSGTSRTAAAATLFNDAATLVQSVDISSFPSPDPAGITYLEFADRLLLSDSEVNEIPDLFAGNLFELTTAGSLSEVGDTLLFSDEPTGLVYNPLNDHVFISDDDDDEVYQLDPGPDRLYGTADDIVSSFDTRGFNSFDPEGIAYDSDQNTLFIVDGNNSEVYRITPGANGQFDGSDDIVTSFDTAGLGLTDPEGIAFDAENGLLYLVGEPKNVLVHVSPSGSLIRLVDIAAASAYNPAGLTLAPGSMNPSFLSIYIADRAVDNNIDPDENDGEIHELFLPPLNTSNLPPGASAGPDLGVVLPNSASLNGSISDDGEPDPPGVVSAIWSKVSGPGTVTFSSPATAITTASFSVAGTYVLRLTADDGVLVTSDDTTVSVLDAPPATGLIYISTVSNGSVGGFTYRDEDILAYDGQNGTWSLYFDGSDVGLGTSRQEIDAFHIDVDGSILLSLRYATSLPDVGAVDDSDIVQFTPVSTGATTAGSYSWFLDASDVGLSGNGEDTDAIGFTPDGRLVISTNGSLRTATASGKDDDLFVLSNASFGAASGGTWSLYFDGSDVGVTDSSEDVTAVALDGSGNIRFATKGSHSIGGLNGDGADIVNCSATSLGATTDCVFTLFWDGAANGFTGSINGLSIDLL